MARPQGNGTKKTTHNAAALQPLAAVMRISHRPNVQTCQNRKQNKSQDKETFRKVLQ